MLSEGKLRKKKTITIADLSNRRNNVTKQGRFPGAGSGGPLEKAFQALGAKFRRGIPNFKRWVIRITVKSSQ